MTSWPGRRCCAIISTADTTYERSGSLVLRSGVGTQMLTVSSLAITAVSVVARADRAVGTRRHPPIGTSRMYDSPLLMAADLSRVEVDADRVEAGAGEFDRERQADVAEADDANAGGAGGQLLEECLGQAADGERSGHRSCV